MLATPHPRYSRIGLSTLYSGDETRPIFDLNLSWPEKQVALLLASEVLNEGKRAFAHVKTPFEELQHLAVDTFYSTPFDRDVNKLPTHARGILDILNGTFRHSNSTSARDGTRGNSRR